MVQSAAVLEAPEQSTVKKPIRPPLLTVMKSSCSEIESVLGSELPPSARKFAAWWGTVAPEPGQKASTQAWVLPRRKKREGESPLRGA